eukprot:1153372-Pelagomonas_calceolata.AAC.2
MARARLAKGILKFGKGRRVWEREIFEKGFPLGPALEIHICTLPATPAWDFTQYKKCWFESSEVTMSKTIDACSNLLYTIQDMTAAISVRLGSPIGDFEHEGKGDALAPKSRESPPPQSLKTKVLMGVWRLTGSTWLQNLAVRSVFVLNGMPTCSGNKFVGIFNRTGIQFASKFHSTLVVRYKDSFPDIYAWIGWIPGGLLFVIGGMFTPLKIRHVSIHGIDNRVVADTVQLPIGFWYSYSQAL